MVDARATRGKEGGNITETFLISKLLVEGGTDIIAMSVVVKSVLKRNLRHRLQRILIPALATAKLLI